MESHDIGQPIEPSAIPAEHQYTGHVGIYPVLRNETAIRVSAVRFWPSARTGWHTHEGDQLLIITDGDGLVVNETSIVRARAGTVVRVPAGEPHWHGARHETEMTHLAISTGASTYSRRVDDDEYHQANDDAAFF